jgi:hypothetical protein
VLARTGILAHGSLCAWVGVSSVHYTVQLAAGGATVYATREHHDGGAPVRLVVGDGTAPKALHTLLPTMRVGEVTRVTCTPAYAWGASGSAAHHVPADTSVILEVELLEVRLCVRACALLRVCARACVYACSCLCVCLCMRVRVCLR